MAFVHPAMGLYADDVAKLVRSDDDDDRDWNAAWNILSRGIMRVGEGRSELTPYIVSHRGPVAPSIRPRWLTWTRTSWKTIG